MSTRRKLPPNPTSLLTFLLAQAGIRTQAVVKDSMQSVAAPYQGFIGYFIFTYFHKIFIFVDPDVFIDFIKQCL